MNPLSKGVHWFNAVFTLGTVTFDLDLFLKIAALLLVTIPLGVVQWINAVEKLKAWRSKRNARTNTQG